MADRVSSEPPLPAGRPARRGAVPADAAARVARRRPRASSRSRSSPSCSFACGRSRCSPASATSRRRTTTACARCGSKRRAARSSIATAVCSSRTRPARASSSGRATCRRPGRRGSRSCAGSRIVTGVPTKEIVAAARQARRRPAHAGRRAARHQAAADTTTSSSTRTEFPGVRLPASYLRKYPYQSLAAQVARLRRPDLPRGLQVAEEEGLPGERLDRAVGDRAHVRHATSAGRTARRSSRSTRAAGPRRRRSRLQSSAPGETLRLTLDIEPPARGRAGARVTAIRTRALERRGRVRRRRRDRRARSAQRGCARDGVEPDLQAVALRRAARTRRSSRRCSNPKVAAEDNFPALNRAIQVGYPPGSTFKPVTALAAMQEHLVTPVHAAALLADVRGLRADVQQLDAAHRPVDRPAHRARRVVRHLLLPARRRLLQAAVRAAATRCRAGRTGFGFGETTGIDIGGEIAGLMPTPEWRCKQFGGPPCAGYVDRIWKPGYSIQLAIGQGDLLVTPLQMTRFYAMIANGGKLVTPHLAEDVEQSGSKGQPLRVLRRFGAQPPQPVNVDPQRCSTSGSVSKRRRTRRSERRRASSGTSRSPSPARPARPRSSCTCRAARTRSS